MSRKNDLIGKLYKPPQHGQQCLALSRADAEGFPVLPGVAIISITAPDRPAAQLEGYENILRLSFADVDFSNSRLSVRAKAKLPEAMTPAHARQVLNFVAALPGDVHTVLVHCEGGFSRSCAVAIALHQLYGFQVEPERLTAANTSIVQLLLTEAKRR